jgi:hypothetical protein
MLHSSNAPFTRRYFPLPSYNRYAFAFLLWPAFVATLAAQTLEHRPQPEPPKSTAANPAENIAPQSVEHPVLVAGTNLQVEITRHYPMKANEAIEGRLLHPVFVDGKLAVPQNTLLRGTVVSLQPDSATRWHGRLRGDFTPFHSALVQFDELSLPGGPIKIATNGAATGAPVVHLAAAGATSRQSIFSRYWSQAKGQLHDRIAYFTAPGLGDRALQVLYHQLPYHPERIEANAMWSFDLTQPVVLPDQPPASPPPAPVLPAKNAMPETWTVHALLTAGVTSATAKPGDPVRALVVEPVFDKDNEQVVPQGSELVGKVTAAKPAKSLGRNGKLRFTFQQVLFPQGTDRQVQGALTGATAGSSQSLSLDAEGTITPRNQASAIAPILLTVLAGRALDNDGNLTAQTGVASNGFGFAGRIVGVASGSRNLAAGIGFYAAGLSFYENFLHPGRDVVFPKDTRIEIETTPLRAPVLTPKTP